MQILPFQKEEESEIEPKVLYYLECNSQEDQEILFQLNTIVRMIDMLGVKKIASRSTTLRKVLFEELPSVGSDRAIYYPTVHQTLREDRAKLKALMSLMMALELRIDQKATNRVLLHLFKSESEEKTQNLIASGRIVQKTLSF